MTAPSTIRLAAPRDAACISALYEAAYTSPDSVSPSDNYAFPQILSPEWVEAALETKMVVWLLAEADDRLMGAAGFGAVRYELLFGGVCGIHVGETASTVNSHRSTGTAFPPDIGTP